MERVPDLPKAPAFNAAAYSDRLQETRTTAGALGAVPVFDKTKDDSIVPFVKWIREQVYGRIQALIEFTSDIQSRQTAQTMRIADHEDRIAELEAKPLPFGSASG